MEKRINLFNLLRNEGQLKTLHVYAAKEVQNDPYEHTKDLVMTNPLPIKGLIRQISFEALKWKYTGLLPQGSIEVIAEKKYETLFQTADKIKYKDRFYSCWKDDAKNFMILKRPDYVIVILGLKNE